MKISDIRNSEWQPAVCVKRHDGSFAIFDSLKEAAQSRKCGELITQYQDVKVRVLEGKLIVDFGDFIMEVAQ